LNGLTTQAMHGGLSPVDAQKQAVARLYVLVQAQAGTLAYVDIFMVLAVGSGIMFLLAFLLKKNDPGGGGDVAVG
jgi:MFS transporter, DHA2 family, multidrug resistance protein